jgi:hypothetical protein
MVALGNIVRCGLLSWLIVNTKPIEDSRQDVKTAKWKRRRRNGFLGANVREGRQKSDSSHDHPRQKLSHG